MTCDDPLISPRSLFSWSFSVPRISTGILLFLTLAACGCLRGAEGPQPLAGLPRAPVGTIELHGELLQPGQDAAAGFWMRIKPADPAFEGRRMVELVYTPPPPAALAGTILVDHPFLLVDHHLRLVAWNGREGLAKITVGAGGYRVTREILVGEGIAARGEESERQVAGPLGWDLRLAPVLLAASWSPDSAARIRVVDFYGELPAAELAWQGARATLPTGAATVEADARGRCARLVGDDGRILISVKTLTIDGK